MIKFLSVLFFIAVSSVASAQQYSLFAAPGKDKSIQLKWMAKNPEKNKGFNIYRKTGTGTWEKINTAPINASPVITNSELETSKNPFPGDSLYASYVQLKNYTGEDEFERMNIDFSLYLSATTNNRLAFHVGIYFEDKTAQPGVTYQYKVAVQDGGSDRDLATSDAVSLNSKLTAPVKLEAVAADSAIHLKWEYNKNFIHYIVYTKPGATGNASPEGAVLVSFQTDENGNRKLPDYFFTQSGLVNGKTYYYQISGVDFFGNESPLSNTANAIPHDMTPPAPIKGFKATKENKGVKLSWDLLTDKDLNGYNVYRSNRVDTGYIKINGTVLGLSANNYTDKPETEGGTAYYYIEAVDYSGNKSYSAPKGIFFPDLNPPKAPSGLTVIADTGLIRLNWNKNTEGDIMGYRVYRALENNKENYNLLMIQPITEVSYIDSQPAQSRNKFLYRITAVDKSYNESPFASAEIRMPDIVPPSAPLITDIEYADGKVSIKWKNQAEPDLKEFSVFRKLGEDSIFTKINKTPLSLLQQEYGDNTAKAGHNYTYAIQATDSAGLVSEYSLSRSIKIPSLLDSNAAAAINNLKADYDSIKQETIVSFSYPNNTDGILGFLILRSTAEGDFYPICSPQKATRFVDSRMQPGDVYYYKIALVTAEGELMESAEQVRVEIK